VSGYPLVIDGAAFSSLVVGGGGVGTRKAIGLLDAGAHVHVVSPEISSLLEIAETRKPSLRITRGRYASEHLVGATIVVAATDDSALNARIAREAREAGKLVNVVDAPELGNFVTPATHRAGDLIVAVTTGGVPTAAARIRDEICRKLDSRYSTALEELAALRRTLLDAGRRPRWAEASEALIGADFISDIETGTLTTRIPEWR
jgi:precorrin-2 dehydrogenase/sirohydrochlorin ferrochelatase